jgi:transcription-repair coupling factor (superfamily II helicase)
MVSAGFPGWYAFASATRYKRLSKLLYKNNDAVFVSIHSLHKISKYKGKEGEEPQLNKLAPEHGSG